MILGYMMMTSSSPFTLSSIEFSSHASNSCDEFLVKDAEWSIESNIAHVLCLNLIKINLVRELPSSSKFEKTQDRG